MKTIEHNTTKIVLQDLSKEVFNMLESLKRVGRTGYDLTDIEKFLRTVDYINSMDEDSKMVNSQWSLADYIFPKVFSFLLEPKYVSIGGDFKFRNLIIKTPQPEGDIMSPQEMRLFSDSIYGSFRMDSVDKTLEGLITNYADISMYKSQLAIVKDDGEVLVISSYGEKYNALPLQVSKSIVIEKQCYKPYKEIFSRVVRNHLINPDGISSSNKVLKDSEND